jgi:hypothetical protein
MILEFVRMYDPGFCIDSECICTMLLWAPLAPISGPPPQQPSPPPLPTPTPHRPPPTTSPLRETAGDHGVPKSVFRDFIILGFRDFEISGFLDFEISEFRDFWIFEISGFHNFVISGF